MTRWHVVLGSIAAVVAAASVVVSAAAVGGTRLAVTSSLDGKRVLPRFTHWLALPNVPSSQVAEVDFLIDGKLRWVEHTAPYTYAGDDEHGHLGYLFTNWLTPGTHRFAARVKTNGGRTATDVVTARVSAASSPPRALAGTWTRVVTKADTKKADPRYGTDNVPPAGKWRLIIDRTGIWELDPLGTGLLQAYAIRANVLRSLAPIQMVPQQASGDPGEIVKFGAHVAVGGGVDCDESGPFGTYRWSASSHRLTLEALHEPCGQRRAIYEGIWTR
jgi:hypothetical protein